MDYYSMAVLQLKHVTIVKVSAKWRMLPGVAPNVANHVDSLQLPDTNMHLSRGLTYHVK